MTARFPPRRSRAVHEWSFPDSRRVKVFPGGVDSGGMKSPGRSALEQLVYLSKARPGLDSVDVRAILGSAQVRNRRKDLTGLLVYSGHHFVQVLEGHAGALDALVAAIKGDERHLGLRVVRRNAIERREYGSWAMRYVESLDVADELEALFNASSARHEEVDRLLAELGAEGRSRGAPQAADRSGSASTS